jgi:hypothetical protein
MPRASCRRPEILRCLILYNPSPIGVMMEAQVGNLLRVDPGVVRCPARSCGRTTSSLTNTPGHREMRSQGSCPLGLRPDDVIRRCDRALRMVGRLKR